MHTDENPTQPTPETHDVMVVMVAIAVPKDRGFPIPEGVDPLAWAEQRISDVIHDETDIAVVTTGSLYDVECVEDFLTFSAPWEDLNVETDREHHGLPRELADLVEFSPDLGPCPSSDLAP